MNAGYRSRDRHSDEGCEGDKVVFHAMNTRAVNRGSRPWISNRYVLTDLRPGRLTDTVNCP